MSPSLSSCRLVSTLREVRQAEVVLGLHLDQPAARAFRVRTSGHFAVQLLHRRRGAHDQLDLAIVELVDQPGEAPHALDLVQPKLRNAGHQHGMVAPRELDVIRGAARTLAQRAEVEPDYAFPDLPPGDRTPLDLDADVGGAALS